jgi:hypothetical protein
VDIKYDEAKNENGEWNWGALVKTVRHECPHCGHVTPDTTAARRALTQRSEWRTEGNDHVDGYRSRRVSAQSVYWIRWSDLVIQWCQASDARHLGVLQPTKDFRMQRLAQPWKLEEELPALELEAAEYFQNEWQDGRAMPEEFARVMTVDCQQDHYWGIVRVWLKNGHSRLLWAGKILTVDQLREIQVRLKVPDKRCLLDAGNSFHGARIRRKTYPPLLQRPGSRGGADDAGRCGKAGVCDVLLLGVRSRERHSRKFEKHGIAGVGVSAGRTAGVRAAPQQRAQTGNGGQAHKENPPPLDGDRAPEPYVGRGSDECPGGADPGRVT